MAKYPLKAKIYEADLNQPKPDSRVAEHIVNARESKDNETGEYRIIDPYNGNEIGAYSSVSEGSAVHDTGMFFWVDEIIDQ